ncbi:hypothetical protein [Tenacibaculum jejuense]|uniref:Uncharacterized protein n=1 Tax=Tenacibaculum jejuense TaxID=584609 RepID=A0A238U7S2_9FLAO|nr:hypothetical protein [Tenacibaculum jejuense]SNR15056.1 conserved protein of unknown function [Tenacibaculum jejuense]
MKLNNSVQNVEKEQIKYFKFPKTEVLAQRNEQINRKIELNRALSLGNLERQKVKIVFVDQDGYKRVETTVWGVTDKAVILKKSTLIPLQRIISVA